MASGAEVLIGYEKKIPSASKAVCSCLSPLDLKCLSLKTEGGLYEDLV